jgi:hypothetical protein
MIGALSYLAKIVIELCFLGNMLFKNAVQIYNFFEKTGLC